MGKWMRGQTGLVIAQAGRYLGVSVPCFGFGRCLRQRLPGGLLLIPGDVVGGGALGGQGLFEAL
jgi:hypothetical protein